MEKSRKLLQDADGVLGDSELQVLRQILEELKHSPLSKEHLKTIRKYEKQLMVDSVNVKSLLKSLLVEIRGLDLVLPENLEVYVKNQVPYPEFPDSVEVSNLKDLPKFPEVKIPDEVEIKESSWMKRQFSGLGERLANELKQASKSISRVKVIDSGDPKKPVAVRLSDGKKFYNAIAMAMGKMGSFVPFVTASGEHKEPLRDRDWETL